MTDWLVFALGSAVFAGLTAILTKLGVEAIPATAATLIRTVVILGCVGLLVAIRREWPHAGSLNLRNVGFLVASGLTTGLSWLCYNRALQHGPVSLVAPLDKLSLVIAIGLSVVILGERLTAWQWLGASCMTLGALLLALK